MSSFEHLWNRVRVEIYRVMQTYSHNKVGEVTSYDPKTHMVKVKLKPRDNETSWIPLHVMHAGNGYGVMVAPHVGDQVEVSMQEGDANTPRVVARLHSDKQKPPQIQEGEALIKTKTGAGIYIDKNGGVAFNSAKGKLLKINMGGMPT